jgi:hypothetical protein
MKKHLALVLALVMVLTSFSFVSAAPDFSDMEGHANAEAVARLEALNVLKGYPDGSFKPDNTITRAEFAAVAVRVSGLENVATAAKGLPTGFTDVPAWHWASGYVGTAAKTGIVNGIGNGLFAPETPVKYEEAITMIVRALGYEPMAQARGGYPFGYLIVANEIDLLEDAMGTQGTWATRGFVAQITDNALEIPMMIQVGFGSDTKWVVSGKEGTVEEFLIERMGFDWIEGRVLAYDDSDMEIDIDDETFEVMEGFDFYEAMGRKVKAWYNSDDVVVAVVLKESVAFDATVGKDADEITLVDADDDFEVARGAVLTLNGKTAKAEDFDADYAKVAMDKDVIQWAEGFTFDGVIVVEDVDDEIIVDLDDEELDVEDFLLVKGGKTISADDLSTGDVVFYNNANDFAVVYNEMVEGVIDRVYDEDSFRLDGTRYTLSLIDAWYIDGDDLGTLNEDVLKEMMDEDAVVEVYTDFAGDVVLVVGDRGVADTSNFYAYVTTSPSAFSVRNTWYYNLDVVNEFGEEVKFDVKMTTKTGIEVGDVPEEVDFVKGEVIEITVDEDGDFDSYALLNAKTPYTVTSPAAVKYDATYAGNYRLQATAVVFMVEEFLAPNGDVDDIKVVKWADVGDEFTEVLDGTFYANSSNRVIAAVVRDSDADDENTEFYGLITGLRQIRNTSQWEILVEVDGDEYEFLTDKDEINKLADLDGVEKGDFARLSVDDRSNLIESVDKEDKLGESFVVSVDTRNNEIEVAATADATTGEAIVLSDVFTIYDDESEEISLRGLSKGDKIEYFTEKVDIDTFVKYVRVTVTAGSTGSEDPIVDEAITLSGDVLTVKGLDSTAAYTLVNTTSGSALKYSDFTDLTTTTFSAIDLVGAPGVYEFDLYKGTAATPVVTEEFFIRQSDN